MNPATDYDTLLHQFYSLKTLCKAYEKELEYYRRKDYATSEHRLREIEEQLESEREVNARLTEELEKHESN